MMMDLILIFMQPLHESDYKGSPLRSLPAHADGQGAEECRMTSPSLKQKPTKRQGKLCKQPSELCLPCSLFQALKYLRIKSDKRQ